MQTQIISIYLELYNNYFKVSINIAALKYDKIKYRFN